MLCVVYNELCCFLHQHLLWVSIRTRCVTRSKEQEDRRLSDSRNLLLLIQDSSASTQRNDDAVHVHPTSLQLQFVVVVVRLLISRHAPATVTATATATTNDNEERLVTAPCTTLSQRVVRRTTRLLTMAMKYGCCEDTSHSNRGTLVSKVWRDGSCRRVPDDRRVIFRSRIYVHQQRRSIPFCVP